MRKPLSDSSNHTYYLLSGLTLLVSRLKYHTHYPASLTTRGPHVSLPAIPSGRAERRLPHNETHLVTAAMVSLGAMARSHGQTVQVVRTTRAWAAGSRGRRCSAFGGPARQGLS